MQNLLQFFCFFIAFWDFYAKSLTVFLFFYSFLDFYAKSSAVFLFFYRFLDFYAKSSAVFLFFYRFLDFYAKSYADFVSFHCFQRFYKQSSTDLDFYILLCYTHIRCKALTRRHPLEICFVCQCKNKVLQGFSPIPGVSQIPMVFDSRDIRQMDVQAPPHGSLFRVK